MSMHSLHGCDVSRIAVLIFLESVYISVCSELLFLFFQEEQHALLLRMLTVSLKKTFVFFSVPPFPPNELVYKVQVLSIA